MTPMSADPLISEGFVPFHRHRTCYGVTDDHFEPLHEPESFRDVVEGFVGRVAGGNA
jgi:hypothetical protein